MIDLHTHTDASDGRYPPAELVARARDAGVTVLAVTDHDTVAGCAAVSDACARAGITFVAGIEITAVQDDRDLHVLGYFFDTTFPALERFLERQRQDRLSRVVEMIDRLRSMGISLDADAIVQPALDDPRKSAGRPWIARALVAGGHVATSDEAFERWLARGRPAYVVRRGPGVRDVVEVIHQASGLASLAHPALYGSDSMIAGFVADGLDALEVYHSDHDEAATSRYRAVALALGIAATGGSDFHGDPSHGPAHPGAVSLPADAYAALVNLNADIGSWPRRS